jgi:hypothetical protein
MSQTTLSTGSIVGTVADPSGAVVSSAKVVITNISTGQQTALSSNASGEYSSGPLAPGNYKVQISAKGFSTVSERTVVQVGNTATVNANLIVGQESTVVEVEGSAVQVNTEQATVQGVLTSTQIENLPVNGRNFLDLAQLEPGVQIQDGQNFDPTKAGYSSISFGGRFGRTARINVDGVDVSDETVGTTTSDIPASAIDEFQLSQSSLDLSQDLTSSGAVNVTTRSGTNAYHGEAFGFFRDHSMAAASAGGQDLYSQRSQYGARLGGPVIKNKLFFFGDGERTKQASFAPVVLSGTPFATDGAGFGQPFIEDNLIGKLDYNLGNGAKAFYRYSYFKNSLLATFGLGFSVYDNKDITRQHVVGFDFASGSFSHSIRFSYLKFQNQIVDSTLNNSALPYCCTGLEISSGSFFVGPNLLAPQSTPQSNREIKYDGSKIYHSHTFRYGVSFNHIQGGGFANFYGTAPRVSFSTSASNCGSGSESCLAFANAGPFPGGSANPLNWDVSRLRVGNGQGFNTLDPALGFPAGGLGPDNRIGLYVGDAWKIKPNFTLTVGLRYDRDTGRSDSDLPADASINAAFPGYGNRVNQPNLNFAPQIGFAWDPNRNGKTVVRGGAGMFYENAIWNNVLFDRPARLQNGAFNAVSNACLGGNPQPVPVSSGAISPAAGICGTNVYIGNVIPQIMSFWQQVLAGNTFDPHTPNPNYAGTLLGLGLGQPAFLFAPDYKSPVSVQMNLGIQREIRHGMVFSADYLRNVETRTLLAIDVNKVGDISTFSKAGAQAAIAAVVANCGLGSSVASTYSGNCLHDPSTGTDDNGTYGTSHNPAHPASIDDFVGNGLGVPNDVAGVGCGQPTSAGGLGIPCAFGGVNPMQNSAFFLKPIGRSVYNALQLKLVQNVTNPVRGVKAFNFQAAYSLSRFSNTGGAQLTGTAGDSDQDFVLSAADQNKPGRYYGPALLDRKHQISFGGYADVPGGFRLGLIAHFYSPLSSAIVAPNFGDIGEIYRTDFTGDGTTGDPVPGTHLGQFDRGTNASQLNTLIGNYNTTQAGQPTPAGNVLVQNGLMTASDLQSLGGVSPHICLAPPAVDNDPSCSPNSPGSQVNFTWLRALDLKLAWRHTFKDRVTIEPSVGFYNLPNFSNFNLPPNTMNGILFGAGNGSINGTTRQDNESFRVGNGTGVYALGAQRQIEFGLRFVF